MIFFRFYGPLNVEGLGSRASRYSGAAHRYSGWALAEVSEKDRAFEEDQQFAPAIALRKRISR
jgi:hypothetical protein